MNRRTFFHILAGSMSLTLAKLPPASGQAHNTDGLWLCTGETLFDKKGQLLIGGRPKHLSHLPAVPVVSGFFDYLKNPVADPRYIGSCGPTSVPRAAGDIRHLFIVTHANNRAEIVVGLDPTHYSVKGPFTDTDFEDVDRAVASRNIEIPEGLVIDGVPVTSATTAIRIMGCRIGSSKPFLEKLKQAMGGRITVIAPNHINWLGSHEAMNGALEFLQYDFEVTTLGTMTRKELITKFIQQSQTGARRSLSDVASAQRIQSPQLELGNLDT